MSIISCLKAVPRIWRLPNKIYDEALKFEKIKTYFHLIINLQIYMGLTLLRTNQIL